MDLDDYLKTSKKNLFRFEYLQEFNILTEQAGIEFWKNHAKIDQNFMREWWNFLESKVSQAVQMRRVRLVRFPLQHSTALDKFLTSMTKIISSAKNE